MTPDRPPDDSGTTPPARPPADFVLEGTSVSPGLAMGAVLRKDRDLARIPPRRIPLDRIEHELNRFRGALRASEAELRDLRQRLSGELDEEDVRILDTHLAYLKDSVFLADVEHLILDEHMSLEAAVGKVISDFDRIFQLVENELLRERAVDLRDVGLRVLRNVDEAPAESEPDRSRAILVARELSIVDMFGPDGEVVAGIVAAEGGLTSHAAILARSLRIPAVAGVPDLLQRVGAGDFLIVDATEGVVRVNPDAIVRAQYRDSGAQATAEGTTRLALPVETADGTRLQVSASCGNLPEVAEAVELGVEGIGLYRTELLFLVGGEPSVDALAAHYAALREQVRGREITFRLLHTDSGTGPAWLHPEREPNPALGLAGVRALLARPELLRRQLQALLAATPRGTALRVAVPFVVEALELRRVRAHLLEQSFGLQRGGSPFEALVHLGAVVETPAAALSALELAAEADFLVLNLDALVQHLLAADRENAALAHFFEPLHPVVLRVVSRLVRAAREAERPLSVFGLAGLRPANLPFLIGAGLREFCVAPVDLVAFAEQVERIDLELAERAFEAALRAQSQAEVQALAERFPSAGHHG